MLKFMVVLHRRPDLSPAEFREYLDKIHAPLAKKVPGLKGYRQNHAADDRNRKRPGWDAIVELYWEDRETMEAAWAGPEGVASDADLPVFADLDHTTWSVVDEITFLP